jgi:hypothetical protein
MKNKEREPHYIIDDVTRENLKKIAEREGRSYEEVVAEYIRELRKSKKQDKK